MHLIFKLLDSALNRRSSVNLMIVDRGISELVKLGDNGVTTWKRTTERRGTK
jgi:hypothetical protein